MWLKRSLCEAMSANYDAIRCPSVAHVSDFEGNGVAMAVRTRIDTITGKKIIFIDLRYRTTDGRKERYRRDAQVQTRTAAIAEERRLVATLATTGKLPKAGDEPPEAARAKRALTWEDAVLAYRTTSLPKVKPSTRRGYLEILEGPLLAPFAKKPLERIADVIPAWDAGIVASGAGASRRRNLHVVVRSVLRTAVEVNLLAEMPKIPKLPKVGETVVDAVNLDDLRRILDEPDDVKHCGKARADMRKAARFALALAAYGGLRSGEIRALRWRDVDLRAKRIVVRATLSGGEEAAPKSGHEREVPIAAPLLAKLAEVAERARAKSKRTERQGPPPDAFVALRADGEPWGETGILQALQRACARLGFEPRRVHALRHFFVTALFEGGAPAHVVQALAGHASLEVTQRYAHHSVEAKRAAIAVLK
jgi:integrase